MNNVEAFNTASLENLHTWVTPTLHTLGFDFNDRAIHHNDNGMIDTILYEASPLDFAQRYPQAGIEESYRDGWPPLCIDLWLEFDQKTKKCEIKCEGFGYKTMHLTGDSGKDFQAIGATIQNLLNSKTENPLKRIFRLFSQ